MQYTYRSFTFIKTLFRFFIHHSPIFMLISTIPYLPDFVFIRDIFEWQVNTIKFEISNGMMIMLLKKLFNHMEKIVLIRLFQMALLLPSIRNNLTTHLLQL